MGSNIGNYEPAEGAELLRLLGGALRRGDGLLLGADLKKDRATLELAYDDPAGVTAAFDRNVLARINRELGATSICATSSTSRATTNARGSVDSFLQARESATVSIRVARLASKRSLGRANSHGILV